MLRPIGEVVTEELEYVPARFIVNRIVRPRLACRCCERIIQAPLPSRPIERGRPGPGLLADVLVSGYADHLPLYRQSQIFEREGIDLDRSTLADWVGKATALLEPLANAIGRHVGAGSAIRADDTRLKRLAPGNGKTKPPKSGSMPATNNHGQPTRRRRLGANSRSTARRRTPSTCLMASFRGFVHADGYAGFNDPLP